MQLAFAGMRGLPDPPTQQRLAFVGVKEALCNLDVALVFVVAAALVAIYIRRRTDIVASAG